MKEPLNEERKEKHFSWLYKLAGKKTKDDISPALRSHTEDLKRDVEEHDKPTLGVPQRSRSVSIASSEKKDTRRKSLADVFSSRTDDKSDKSDKSVKLVRADGDGSGSGSDRVPARELEKPEKKPLTDAEKAKAKAKKAEEQALAAKLEATRLIAEANKAIAAAAKANADAAFKASIDSDLLSVDQSRVSTSTSERGTGELELSQNSAREDSLMTKGGFDDTGSVVLLPDDGNSPRESTSRGGLLTSISKKTAPGSLGVDDENSNSRSNLAATAIRIEREAKIRSEYALVAERAAKKAIKNAAKAKKEAEAALTKATEVESKEQAKEAKRRNRSPKAKKNELEVHSEYDPESGARKSASSMTDLERMPSTSSLVAPVFTLNEVLAREEGIVAFKQFAAEGFVLENISFVLEVRAFDLLDESVVGTEAWQKRAHEIFDTYVQVGSAQEVNVTSKIRKDVVEKFEQGTIGPGVFKGLAAEALQILRTNDWPQFIKSEHYRKFEASNPPPSPAAEADR